MNYLSATGISKAYGPKVLFEELTFGIDRGAKVALVGRNGCGKSTLLRILTGLEGADSGEVSIRKGLRVDFLTQEPDFGDAKTVREAVHQGEKPQEWEDWEYEVRIKEMLGKLGVHDVEQAVSELSGGQRKRLALARVLVHAPDLLMLDEPTNHLDTDTIEWLENHLATNNTTLILVTHDRYFLDRVCNEIIELDKGEMFRYAGNYTFFVEKKAEREAQADLDAQKAQNLLRTELEWLRRMPKARTTKSKAKVNQVHQRMEDAQGPSRDKNIQLNFKARRLGKKILELDHVAKGYDDLQLVRDFSYVFKRGERIGIVGPNGIGKTTFLDVVTGKIQPDTGTVTKGETIHFGYYTQKGLHFKPGQVVREVITETAEQITMGTGEKLGAAMALTLFGFPPPVQNTRVSELSGGEKRRLYLLRVLMEQPNFLILDEPTNDLDLITLNTLEQFLLGFGGCLIIVSHDRYFLDKLCDHIFVFEGEGAIKPFPGTFREYRARKKAEAQQSTAAEKPKSDTRVRERTKTKLSFNEKREYAALEGEIEELETRKSELEGLINSGSTDYEALQQWAAELEQVSADLETKSDRWLELAEFVED